MRFRNSSTAHSSRSVPRGATVGVRRPSVSNYVIAGRLYAQSSQESVKRKPNKSQLAFNVTLCAAAMFRVRTSLMTADHVKLQLSAC